MTVIYKKELRVLFGGFLPYGAVAFLLLACGFYTSYYNLFLAYTDITYTLTGSFYALILALPMLTCGLYVYEKRSGATALWYSLGLRPYRIVLGKFFAALTVLLIVLLPLAIHPFLIARFGTVDTSACMFAIFGYVLLCIALLAICSFISLFGRKKWIPFCIGLGVMLLLWAAQRFLTVLPVAPWFSFVIVELLLLGVGAFLYFVVGSHRAGWISCALPALSAILFAIKPTAFVALIPRVLAKINPFSRFSGFIYGSFDLEGIVYFVSVTVLFLALTVLVLRCRRDESV